MAYSNYLHLHVYRIQQTKKNVYTHVGYCTQAGLLAVLETRGVITIIIEGKAQGDYRCILKSPNLLRDLLECNNQLRLWAYILYEIRIFYEVSVGF